MPARQCLLSILLLGSLLMLLASRPVAAARPPGSPPISASDADCLCPTSDQLPGQPASLLDAPVSSDALPSVTALAFENEEQDRVEAPHQVRVAFSIPRSFRMIHDRQSLLPCSVSSLYPLRC